MTEMTDQNTDNLIRTAAFDIGHRLGRIEGMLAALLSRLDRAAPSSDTDTDRNATR